MIAPPRPVPLRRDPLWYLALLAGVVYWLVLYTLQSPDLQWNKPLSHAQWFLGLVVLSPLLEEIVFRGLVQELVREYLGSAAFGPLTLANLITSVLFALAHLYYHPAAATLQVFFPSLLFGFFKERTGALPAPVLLHAFYNAGFAWLFMTPP